MLFNICRKHHIQYPHHFIGPQAHLLRPWYTEVERRKRLRSELYSRRKKRKKESSNEHESCRQNKCTSGDEVLSTLECDKHNQIEDPADPIRTVGKGDDTCLKNVSCRNDEVAGKNKKKTLGTLTLEKIRQKHGMSNSPKRPLMDRLQMVKTPLKQGLEVTKTPLKQRSEVTKTPLKKRIELIKRAKKEEEGLVLIKKEACGKKFSR